MPLSVFAYKLKAFERLYYVSCEHGELFEENAANKAVNFPSEYKNTAVDHVLENLYKARLKPKYEFKLFCYDLFSCCLNKRLLSK